MMKESQKGGKRYQCRSAEARKRERRGVLLKSGVKSYESRGKRGMRELKGHVARALEVGSKE